MSKPINIPCCKRQLIRNNRLKESGYHSNVLSLLRYTHRQKLINSKLVLNIKKGFVPKYWKFKFHYLHLTSFEAKEKYRGVFEIQRSRDKTSSGEIGLDIRTHASPKVGQDQVSGGVSVLCWHAAPVANVLWKPCTIR